MKKMATKRSDKPAVRKLQLEHKAAAVLCCKQSTRDVHSMGLLFVRVRYKGRYGTRYLRPFWVPYYAAAYTPGRTDEHRARQCYRRL